MINNTNNGLAEQLTAPTANNVTTAGNYTNTKENISQQQMMEFIMQIVELLKQGVTEQELINNGIPTEFIDIAKEQIGTYNNEVKRSDEGIGLAELSTM